MNEASPTDTLKALNKLLISVLRDLADAGQLDQACTYSGQAWRVLRDAAPEEASKHNGLLHALTAPKKTA